MKVGKLIQALRKEKDMTLEELSKLSGVAVATLSRIENEHMTGTLSSHSLIAQALGISLPELYSSVEKEDVEQAVKIKARQGKVDLFLYDKHSSYQLLTKDVLKKKMMPIILKVVGATHKEESRFGTEKFIYVLDGVLEASLLDMKYVLKRGDSLYFDASVTHSFKNLRKSEARCICVITPPAL